MDDIQISEKKLEDFIYKHLSGEDFYPGFDEIREEENTPDFVFRQMNLGSYGIADIVTFNINCDGSITADIYELKKNIIQVQDVIQVFRYKKGIKELFYKIERYCKVYCFLIGSGVSDNEELSIGISEINNLFVYTYDICPKNGIVLNGHNVVYQNKKISKITKNQLTCIDYKSSHQRYKYLEYTLNQDQELI